MASGENVVPWDCRVEPLQFRHPESRLRNCSGRNFSEKLEVIRIYLFKNGDRASCSCEVNAAGGWVVLDVVCAAHAVEHQYNFPRVCIHDNQLARFMLVSASNIARMGFGAAANKQAMMGCVETRGMGHRPSGDWPLSDHGAFFEIDHRNMAVAINNISH